MATPNLPAAAVRRLAELSVREHHATWHYVRDRWHQMSAAERQPFITLDWKPPRLNPVRRNGEPVPPLPDPGAGVDFLAMHRAMIRDLNEHLSEIGDPAYARAEGWAPIPWDHSDPDWPMPPDYPNGAPWAKAQAETDRWEALVRERYENDEWLAGVSLDQLGSELERGIHNWLHMHWASRPWYRGLPGQREDDVRNDYLGSTFSSHVNKAFWKLHGWIDDRIAQWERVHGTTADLSDAWNGPAGGHHSGHHDHLWASESAAPPPLLTDGQRAFAETFFVGIVPDDV